MDVLQYLPHGSLVNLVVNKDNEIAELKAKVAELESRLSLAQAPVVPEWVSASNAALARYATDSVVLRGRISKAGYDIGDNEVATERAWQIIRDLKDPK